MLFRRTGRVSRILQYRADVDIAELFDIIGMLVIYEEPRAFAEA
jgi:hypothetical protein